MKDDFGIDLSTTKLTIIKNENKHIYSHICEFCSKRIYSYYEFIICSEEDKDIICPGCAKTYDTQILNIFKFLTGDAKRNYQRFNIGINELRKRLPVRLDNQCDICNSLNTRFILCKDSKRRLACFDCKFIKDQRSKDIYQHNGKVYTRREAKKLIKLKAFL